MENKIYTGNIEYPDGFPSGYGVLSPDGNEFKYYASPSFIGWLFKKIPPTDKTYINGVLVDIPKTTAELIKEAETEYYTVTQTPVAYKGKLFKPAWAELYTDIIPSYKDDISKKDIWDITETAFLSLTKAELTELKQLLFDVREVAFQQMKRRIADIKKE